MSQYFIAIYTLRLEERPSHVAGGSRRHPKKRLLGVRRHQDAFLGQDVTAAEATAVRQQWAVLPQQQPFIGSEGPVEPQRVRGDRGGELRAVPTLTQSVH